MKISEIITESQYLSEESVEITPAEFHAVRTGKKTVDELAKEKNTSLGRLKGEINLHADHWSKGADHYNKTFKGSDLNEISDEKRNRYVARASDDYGMANFAARASKSHPGLEDYSKEQEARAKKRSAGLNRALSDRRTGRGDDVAEATGDKKFDDMMKRVVKKPTQAQRNAERIRQKKEREAETKAHFANGGGFGPSPAAGLGIRKPSVTEASDGTSRDLTATEKYKLGAMSAMLAKERAEKQARDLKKTTVKQGTKKQGVAEYAVEEGMSRAAKGHEKYGKDGMKALAKAGRDGASEETLDKIRDKHDRYDDNLTESLTADEQFDIIEEMVESLAESRGVDSELIWEYFEKIDDNKLFETATWQKKAGKNKKGGLNAKGVASYRRANPGSKLQTAVTTKPSKLKPGSKAAKRRKSFCARMGGMKGPMKDEKGKPTRKALSLRKWNC